MSDELVWNNDTIYIFPKIEKPIKVVFEDSTKVIDNEDGTITIITTKYN